MSVFSYIYFRDIFLYNLFIFILSMSFCLHIDIFSVYTYILNS